MTSLNMHTHQTPNLFNFFKRLRKRLRCQMQKRQRRKCCKRRELNKILGAVEAIVEGTDVRLRGVSNYKHLLRDCACDLLNHIENLVDSLPSPIVIDSNSLSCDPLVRTLLSDTTTIKRILIRNRDIQEYFNSLEHYSRDELFALLFIRHTEKTILGSEIHGEIILREVKQTAFSFYGHRLIAPSPTEEAARVEMIITLFESVVRYIKDQFLQQKKEYIYQHNSSFMIDFEKNINIPEVYLKKLIEKLRSPTELIKIQDNLVRVSKLGIKLPLDSPVSSNLLRLYELQVGDDGSCVVNIIRYPREGLVDQYNSNTISL